MTEQNNTTNSLAHTKWNCKYHIVFAPKYRRKVFYAEKREDIREIIRTLCQWKGVEIIEGEVCPDHIHLLLSIPPKLSVSGFMGYLKGKSSLMIFQKYGNMKFAYRNREFWCKGYYVDTVPSLDKGRHGFDGQKWAHTSSSPLTIRQYPLRAFPCLDTFLLRQNCLHLTGMDLRAVFGF